MQRHSRWLRRLAWACVGVVPLLVIVRIIAGPFVPSAIQDALYYGGLIAMLVTFSTVILANQQLWRVPSPARTGNRAKRPRPGDIVLRAPKTYSLDINDPAHWAGVDFGKLPPYPLSPRLPNSEWLKSLAPRSRLAALLFNRMPPGDNVIRPHFLTAQSGPLEHRASVWSLRIGPDYQMGFFVLKVLDASGVIERLECRSVFYPQEVLFSLSDAHEEPSLGRDGRYPVTVFSGTGDGGVTAWKLEWQLFD